MFLTGVLKLETEKTLFFQIYYFFLLLKKKKSFTDILSQFLNFHIINLIQII